MGSQFECDEIGGANLDEIDEFLLFSKTKDTTEKFSIGEVGGDIVLWVS